MNEECNRSYWQEIERLEWKMLEPKMIVIGPAVIY